MKDTTQDMTEGMVLENAEAPRDAGDEAARLEKENIDLKAELLEAKAQLAALMKGVKAERVPYVLRLAALDGIDPMLTGADDAISAAVAEVLQQIPEWADAASVHAGIGSMGDHKRSISRGVYGSDDTDAARRGFARGMR